MSGIMTCTDAVCMKEYFLKHMDNEEGNDGELHQVFNT